MADYTLEELKTILINLINSIGSSGDLTETPWGTMMEFMSRWEEIQEFLDNMGEGVGDSPSPSNPPDIPPMINKYTQIKLTRCKLSSIQEGGRWEAASNLKGLVVMVIDQIPVELWYCTGIEWRKVNSLELSGGKYYGYITDDTPLAYNKGDTIQIPVSKLMNIAGTSFGLSTGMQIVDKYHAIGIIVNVLLPEFEDDIEEPTAIVVTWVGEADGTNIYTNEPEPEPEPEPEGE
jgi:hypothetical protein